MYWSRAVKSRVNQGLYLFLVLNFLNAACLFKVAKKALLKSNQASSTDGMRSISFQDTWARSIRKALMAHSDEGWSFDRGPITHAGNEAVIAETELYLEGKLVRMISKKVPMVTDLGLYLVGSLIICVRLRASSLDCRTAYLSLGHQQYKL